MASFKNADFVERRNVATDAKKAALEKFRANAAAPAFAERQIARTAGAADRKIAKKAREVEKAEKRARDAEQAKQAATDAAAAAATTLAENAKREVALLAENKAARDARYAARKARSKRR